ncbi:uncharacterized protein LOC143785102 isoform X1 [Ranitomeya variabilis]|uniref:uncharacterized protein LOC143785102 isoform X1 n=1 Tax=Ranitomeya variabilis TaxID=490064 RepID=UPI004056E636
MSGNPARSQPGRWMKCPSCNLDCCACCTPEEWCMKCPSCNLDCCTCCTPEEGWMKCLSCNLDCCTPQDETGALLGNDNGRQRTTPQSTTIRQQPTPSLRGNSVGSGDRPTQRMDNSPEPTQTMSENNDEQQEKTPQRTKSNQDSEERAGEFSNGKSSSFEDKLEHMRIVIRKSPNKKVKVGIFSRAVESEYEWLKAKLESQSFVKSVRPYYISNSGMPEFSSNESRCDFGILYHTKNRGRVNLTDVTDSLYDEELEELSSTLEKKNVIVVIDDLTDSSEERKKEILKDQPKLGSLAADVFLFSEEEKKRNKESIY